MGTLRPNFAMGLGGVGEIFYTFCTYNCEIAIMGLFHIHIGDSVFLGFGCEIATLSLFHIHIGVFGRGVK